VRRVGLAIAAFPLFAARDDVATLAVDVLGGFQSEDGRAHGRPLGVAFDKSGALVVAGDLGNRMGRVSARS
jgi:glucose/arabinose dehydrogenase